MAFGDERLRTYNQYNLDYTDSVTDNEWGFPDFDTTDTIPSRLIGFNEVLSAKKFDCGVHFYIDDYQFERIWNNPEKYMNKLKKFECVIAPDFSLYINMPKAMQLWNVYRSRAISKALDLYGIKVIPCIQFADEDSYSFCFDGLEKGKTVSLSSVGIKRDRKALDIWFKGVNEMIKRLEPKVILLYGKNPGYDFGNIKVIEYDSSRGKGGGTGERK